VSDPEKLEAPVLGALADLTAPPPAPRAAMWDKIAAQWDAARGPATVAMPPARRNVWVAVARAAAVLAIGIALGRATVARTPGARTRIEPSGARATARPAALTGMLARHLSDAEVLLAEFRAESAAAPEVAARAADLLETTRLLLDAPAARDPNLHAVLEDLELVLVQLARVQANRDDVGFVRDTIEQRDLLGRLHVTSARDAI
jgi:hypothetical protein